MKVMKFGGTSVGKPERMHQVAQLIISGDQPKIVVLSALSGTTNSLVEIATGLANNDRTYAKNQIDKLQAHYRKFIDELLVTDEAKEDASRVIGEHFEFFNIILRISYSEALKKDILAQGELMSTKLFCAHLKETGVPHALLPALDFMQIDAYEEPLVGNIKVKLSQLLKNHKDKLIFVTQGYVCRNSKGEVDNLKRGGSDYSASL
ncbi:MAG TPA: aspartate kinase, partial [Segetibacter sp.]